MYCMKEVSICFKMFLLPKTYPGTLAQAVKTKLVCNLGGVHGILNDEVRLCS